MILPAILLAFFIYFEIKAIDGHYKHQETINICHETSNDAETTLRTEEKNKEEFSEGLEEIEKKAKNNTTSEVKDNG